MKYCRHCGAELKDDAKFCVKCGQRVSDENEQLDERPVNKLLVNAPRYRFASLEKNIRRDATTMIFVFILYLVFLIVYLKSDPDNPPIVNVIMIGLPFLLGVSNLTRIIMSFTKPKYRQEDIDFVKEKDPTGVRTIEEANALKGKERIRYTIKTFREPKKTLTVCVISLLVILICIVTSIIGFAGKFGGGHVGYYSAFSTLDADGDGYSDYHVYLHLNSDKTVDRYLIPFGDVNESHLSLVDGTGSWAMEDGKLVITAADQWALFSWETSVTTYEELQDGFWYTTDDAESYRWHYAGSTTGLLS